MAMLATAPSTANATSNPSAIACTELANLYPAFTLFPNSTKYTLYATAFWDRRSNLQPACIFTPFNADQVSVAMKTLHDHDTQFAIRGGGHMPNPGANNINDGILLTLANLDLCVLSADRSTFEVGPGDRWVDFQAVLDEFGLYLVGARTASVGVAGSSLIGGIHWFNNKYGWAMDNVDSYDAVLGNGTQVTANRTSHRDLFWGLKGSANNLGVVTKFTVKTHDIPRISTTVQTFEDNAVQDFIVAVCDFVEADDPSIGAGAIITLNYNLTTGLVSPTIEQPAPRLQRKSTILDFCAQPGG